MYIHIHIYIYTFIPRRPAGGAEGTLSRRFEAGDQALVCFMHVSSSQGAPEFAALFVTVEENLR